MYQNIPAELRERLQWVCANADKVPLNPRTGQPASVVDPGTWASFADACRAGTKYIGFVLTAADPYAIIDLDNKPKKPVTPEEWKVHQDILTHFVSYTERSASGTGYHVVIRGTLPRGRRRGNIEVYSNERYMIFTGDVVRNVPIADCQQLLEYLVAQMPEVNEGIELEERDAVLSDKRLFEMAMRAANSDKYEALVMGRWKELGYPSQSEADYALMAMLAYYSKDNEQCRRMFRYSALGQRDKAQRDAYLNTMLQKMRAKEGPPVSFPAITQAAIANGAAAAVPQPPTVPRARASAHAYELPPGLVGQLAQFFYHTSVRPVQEVALCAAIALTAGVAGRAYNISGTGLNQYILLLAKTGTGKEGASKAIDRLIDHVRPHVPMVDDFFGPGAFASGQALIRILDDKPCFMSLLGEFGLTLQSLNDNRANAAEKLLKKVLLDLYSKSGFTDVLRPTAYSDREKNTRAVRAPSLTIMGEATPETFYEGIDAGDIADGLIPRFHVVEYTGPRPHRNRNANCQPPSELVQAFSELVVTSLTVQNNNTCQPVQVQPDALELLDAFDVEATNALNNAGSGGEAQLWNRAHLKALKLAALLAVGCNPQGPVVTLGLATWAVEFVRTTTNALLRKFFQGEVGIGDTKQEADLRKVIEEYMHLDVAHRQAYKINNALWERRLITRDYLWRRCSRMASFYKDKRGAARALADTLVNMLSREALMQVPPSESETRLGRKQAIYYVGESW